MLMTFSSLLSSLQVEREFRILSALQKVSFPVPKPLLFCADRNVIGTEFYVMEHVKVGFIYIYILYIYIYIYVIIYKLNDIR